MAQPKIVTICHVAQRILTFLSFNIGFPIVGTTVPFLSFLNISTSPNAECTSPTATAITPAESSSIFIVGIPSISVFRITETQLTSSKKSNSPTGIHQPTKMADPAFQPVTSAWQKHGASYEYHLVLGYMAVSHQRLQ